MPLPTKRLPELFSAFCKLIVALRYCVNYITHMPATAGDNREKKNENCNNQSKSIWQTGKGKRHRRCRRHRPGVGRHCWILHHLPRLKCCCPAAHTPACRLTPPAKDGYTGANNMTKRKPGRPKSTNPRQNVRIRLPQPTLDKIDALVGSQYTDRTAVIEAAVIDFLEPKE